MTETPPFSQRLAWQTQSLAARALFGFARLLPFQTASNLGGWLGRTVGPLSAITRRAQRNLKIAFPDLSDAEKATILRGMWDNLSRALFEFPHLDQIDIMGPDSPVEVRGVEHIEALRDDGIAGVFFSGHFANWELLPLTLAQNGIRVHSVYRAPNNPYMASLFDKRGPGAGELIPKGAKGARQALKLLNAGEHLGLLVDQKMNDGIAVPFFGRDAMTAPALAQFALKYDCPVSYAQIERIEGARFRVTYFPPIKPENTGDRHADVAAFMTKVNGILEGWIRQRPEQWLWLHNRWPSD